MEAGAKNVAVNQIAWKSQKGAEGPDTVSRGRIRRNVGKVGEEDEGAVGNEQGIWELPF